MLGKIKQEAKQVFHKNKSSGGPAHETADPADYPNQDSSASHPASPHPGTHEHLANALDGVISQSAEPMSDEQVNGGNVGGTALAPGNTVHEEWFSKYFTDDTFDKLFAKEHLGNFVIDRKTKQKSFEAMPIYARVGMHLLFYGKAQTALLHWGTVEKLLKEESVKQGKIYDETDPKIVYPHILSFCKTYSVDTSILLQPDLHQYKTLNDFFSRKLKPEVRPIAAPEDPSVVVSCADCRLTIFETVEEACLIWVKGRHFTIPNLLNDQALDEALGPNPSVAIFRLAPQDYHRYHSPVAGVLRSIVHVPGEYYTVNPQAVNEPGFDVFTANKRDVAMIEAKFAADTPAVPIGFVAVGALLVASISWTKEIGEPLTKGEDLGYFQYGGSTVILVFPQGSVTFDEDIVGYSKAGVETLVHVGERIGVANPAFKA